MIFPTTTVRGTLTLVAAIVGGLAWPPRHSPARVPPTSCGPTAAARR